MFDRFRQEDSSSTRKHGGLGLGLGIVQHIVSLHHGSVSAASEGKDRGSTFTVTLPCFSANVRGPVKESQAAVDERARVLSEVLSGKEILVVDDAIDVLVILKHALEKYGARVEARSSVDDAIEWLKDSIPHLVISDIGMPQRDGYELIHELRNWPDKEKREVKAIALTAYAQEEDKNRALEAGYDEHLTKPISTPQFLKKVEKLLETR